MSQDTPKNKYYVMLCAEGEASGEIELSAENFANTHNKLSENLTEG